MPTKNASIFSFLIYLVCLVTPNAYAVVPPGGHAGHIGQCLPNTIAHSFTASSPNFRPLNALVPRAPVTSQLVIVSYLNGTFRLNVDIWRVPCPNSAIPVTLMRLTTSGTGTRLGSFFDGDFSITQNGITAKAPDMYPCSGLSNCANSFLELGFSSDNANTTIIGPLNNEIIDLSNAFSVTFFGSSAVLNVPAHGTSTTNPIALKGALSGSWLDPARSGEGFLIDVGTVGSRNVFFVAWFTHLAGNQQWLAGSVDFAEGATSISVPLVTVKGTGFGNQFNAAQLVTSNWGNATFRFDSCNQLTVSYSGGGETATRVNRRLLDGLKGVACP